MKYPKTLFSLILLIVTNSCMTESDEVNQNLARLNNKSWQISRIVDSLNNYNKQNFNEIFEGNQDKEYMLDLLAHKLKTDSIFKDKWIEFQEINNKADSLEHVRELMLDTINTYVAKYSKLHPEENVIIR